MTKKYIRKCKTCGKEFEPLNSYCLECFECYKITKRSKVKVPVKINKKEINSKINKSQSLTRPLNDEEKATIAHLLGRYASITEIKDYFEKETGKIVNYQSIKSIRDSDRWANLIEKNRNEWLSQIKEVPIANKRVRMESWQTMLESGFKAKQMNVVKNALVGARDEMEGVLQQHGGQTHYSLTYIANMSNNELLKKRDILMKKLNHITKSVDTEEVKPVEIENIEENNTEEIVVKELSEPAF